MRMICSTTDNEELGIVDIEVVGNATYIDYTFHIGH